jgi:hypothetical protein
MGYDNQNVRDAIPLSFVRIRNGSKVTGLTVTVTVVNVKTGATILASTNVPEVGAGSGLYSYTWTHGQTQETDCLVTYTVAGFAYCEFLTVSDDDVVGRAT